MQKVNDYIRQIKIAVLKDQDFITALHDSIIDNIEIESPVFFKDGSIDYTVNIKMDNLIKTVIEKIDL